MREEEWLSIFPTLALIHILSALLEAQCPQLGEGEFFTLWIWGIPQKAYAPKA